ncbi:hypothetical protein EVAR_41216_1 [Eumeta japonica]|uniref:Uncharacterized protein n=1 Tax=Eumeta variegata TaxID=151549 RepID=A0A4C1W700_EUMVA|nr:hypothetical protein EVAR_41216_1 [Eumeta japonica]
MDTRNTRRVTEALPISCQGKIYLMEGIELMVGDEEGVSESQELSLAGQHATEKAATSRSYVQAYKNLLLVTTKRLTQGWEVRFSSPVKHSRSCDYVTHAFDSGDNNLPTGMPYFTPWVRNILLRFK